MSVEPSDEELSEGLRRKDAEALRLVLRRYEKPLYGYLRAQVRDNSEAEDLFAKVWIRVWRAAETYDERGRLSAWLFTIARRLVLDHVRAAGRQPKQDSLDAAPGDEAEDPTPLGARLPSADPDPAAVAARAEERSRLEAALQELPSEQREVFLMREQAGLSFAEISRATGVPIGTALARMRYAVTKLRRQLEDLHHA